jgi:hypothetical protein
MQGGCGSSTSSSSLSSTGLTWSTACAAQAMQSGKIGTLHVTIGAVCLTMSLLLMQQGCVVILMQEASAILLGIAIELFVQYACLGMQNIARSWSKLAKEG